MSPAWRLIFSLMLMSPSLTTSSNQYWTPSLDAPEPNSSPQSTSLTLTRHMLADARASMSKHTFTALPRRPTSTSPVANQILDAQLFYEEQKWKNYGDSSASRSSCAMWFTSWKPASCEMNMFSYLPTRLTNNLHQGTTKSSALQPATMKMFQKTKESMNRGQRNHLLRTHHRLQKTSFNDTKPASSHHLRSSNSCSRICSAKFVSKKRNSSDSETSEISTVRRIQRMRKPKRRNMDLNWSSPRWFTGWFRSLRDKSENSFSPYTTPSTTKLGTSTSHWSDNGKHLAGTRNFSIHSTINESRCCTVWSTQIHRTLASDRMSLLSASTPNTTLMMNFWPTSPLANTSKIYATAQIHHVRHPDAKRPCSTIIVNTCMATDKWASLFRNTHREFEACTTPFSCGVAVEFVAKKLKSYRCRRTLGSIRLANTLNWLSGVQDFIHERTPVHTTFITITSDFSVSTMLSSAFNTIRLFSTKSSFRNLPSIGKRKETCDSRMNNTKSSKIGSTNSWFQSRIESKASMSKASFRKRSRIARTKSKDWWSVRMKITGPWRTIYRRNTWIHDTMRSSHWTEPVARFTRIPSPGTRLLPPLNRTFSHPKGTSERWPNFKSGRCLSNRTNLSCRWNPSEKKEKLKLKQKRKSTAMILRRVLRTSQNDSQFSHQRILKMSLTLSYESRASTKTNLWRPSESQHCRLIPRQRILQQTHNLLQHQSSLPMTLNI